MKTPSLVISLLASLFAVQIASAHCQVPCGIFGDERKFAELEEHVVTIVKASSEIVEIAAVKDPSAREHQQLIRWTINKEKHAQKIIDEAANYFLAQRIKPGAEHYAEKIELLHHIMVFAMKAKQNVDEASTDTLSEKIAAFKALYLDHSHAH